MKRFTDGDIHTRVARSVWSMRSKPSSVTGKSPALLFLGRELAHHLQRLHPRSGGHSAASDSGPNPFKPDQEVWFYKHAAEQSCWLPGIVAAMNGARSCDVKLVNGEVRPNVHFNYLRPRLSRSGDQPPPPSHLRRRPLRLRTTARLPVRAWTRRLRLSLRPPSGKRLSRTGRPHLPRHPRVGNNLAATRRLLRTARLRQTTRSSCHPASAATTLQLSLPLPVRAVEGSLGSGARWSRLPATLLPRLCILRDLAAMQQYCDLTIVWFF
jgi:hypothetical protein